MLKPHSFRPPKQVIVRRAAPLLGWSWTMEAFHQTRSCLNEGTSDRLGIEWLQYTD